MANIFLSYSRVDSERAEELFEKLTQALRSEKGVHVWSDREIEPGSNWMEAIEHELERATSFILVLSPAYLNSDYAAFEIGVAMARSSLGEAQVIPLLVADINADDLPPLLRHRTLIDARGKSAEQAAKLITDLVQRSPRERRA
jgi:TIR domain-containing protein